jgi:Mg-chelatase subunit ChlD
MVFPSAQKNQEQSEVNGMEKAWIALKAVWLSLTRDWSGLLWRELHFDRANEAILAGAVICFTAVFVLIVHRIIKKPGRKNIFLPAFLPVMRQSLWRYARYAVPLLMIAGFAFFLVALADPTSPSGYEEVVAPGMRIGLIVDASGSMSEVFLDKRLKTSEGNKYFTAIAASEYLMRLRIKHEQQDLIALLEFASDTFVITPFTPDYKTVLTNIGYIGDPDEWKRLGQSSTYILKAVHQGLELFKTYGFLDASGNILIVVSDGEDTQVEVDLGEGKSAKIGDVVAEARRVHIPIYFIRTDAETQFGQGSVSQSDAIWKDLCDKTGGKFFVADNEDAVIAAMETIDRVAQARITHRHYSEKKPHYRIFAMIAAALWAQGIFLWSCCAYFRRFP